MKKVIYNNKEIFPTKIICVGRNYYEHIFELNNKVPDEIVLFIKPNSSISYHLIKPELRCRYEGEICFLINKNNIEAVGFGLDLTLIDEQEKAKNKGLPWEKAKSFNNSAIFSNFVKFNNINNLSMKLFINNNLRQEGDISLMIYKPYEILKEINKFFSLEDGDIIMTGTPKGVGEFNKDDIFIGQIFEDNKLLIDVKWKVL